MTCQCVMTPCQVSLELSFPMAFLEAGVAGGQVDPLTMLIIASVALVAAIFANTYYTMLQSPSYKWQYGLFRFIAFGGMAVLSFLTAGVGAAVPTITTFLGMELQRLMMRLDIQLQNHRSEKIVKAEGK